MSPDANPWLDAGDSSGTMTGVEELLQAPAPPPVTGPQAPQAGVRPPEPADRDRFRTVRWTVEADVWIMGAHGGAGETTLACLDPNWAAAQHGWPMPPSGRANVLLATRTSALALEMTRNAATQWAASGSGLGSFINLLGVVITPSIPKSSRQPRALRDLEKLMAGAVPRVWHLPWNDGWYAGEGVALNTAPPAARKLVHDVRTIIHQGARPRLTR